MKSIQRMLSQRKNLSHEGSVCDEIRSGYAQQGCTFYRDVHILSLAENAQKFVPRMLSGDDSVSSYAQCAIKSFPRMLSMRML